MSFSIATIVLTAVVGLFVFFMQAEKNRQHEILSERRAIYLEYAEVLAAHMYRQININSEQHFFRRDGLNRIGLKLAIVATDSIRHNHRKLVEHLSNLESNASEDGAISNYFDSEAERLADLVLDQMRIDALPRRIRSRTI